MRRLLPLGLFAAAVLGIASADLTGQNAKQPDKKADAKNKYAPPAAVKPDDAALKQIADKTDQLRKAVDALREKNVPTDVLAEVEIHLKAALNIVRFDEWYHKDAGKWAQTTLDRGLERAKQAEGGKAPWREETGRWVLRAYRSKVDGSIQPYAVLLPHDYGKDPKKKWRLDIVLHGRDSSITEAKFIATHDRTKEAPKDLGYVQLEVYGRGNNAYRWAGERDVFEAVADFKKSGSVDDDRQVLRGFSMGGAGTWHLGLHHPFDFAVIGPGAGFTTTHGYIKGLPNPLPQPQESTLRIYDAVDYTDNAFNVPVVAYSGEIDPQKAAADNIEKKVKELPEKVRFTHLVAPGLEHKMPPEWQAKAEAEYQKYVGPGRPFPEHLRFVTYTLRYNLFRGGFITGLDMHYQKAAVEVRRTKEAVAIKTENVRGLTLLRNAGPYRGLPDAITIDDQRVVVAAPNPPLLLALVKENGKWRVGTPDDARKADQSPGKNSFVHGPIDDAFMDGFVVVPPNPTARNANTDSQIHAALGQFTALWDRYFRGTLPTRKADAVTGDVLKTNHLVLFGEPDTNPLIAKVLPKLPITWTKDKLVVNGIEYDPKTHVPVLIYPNPLNPKQYVVLNSGHTFKEADLKGTNALLYPRLGDWAVLKVAPTAKDPAAAEVVAAGLFDENWQFPTK